MLLPDLSRRLRANDDGGARTALSRAAEVSLALTIPSAIALMVIPLPLVSVLFERGAATSDDSAAIAVAVSIYGLGLPAFVLQKILQPVFFARENTKTPFHYAVWSMVINAALAIGLAPAGWLAPAIATTCAAWAMVAMLGVGARRYGDVAKFDHRFHARIWRMVFASFIMGGVLWWATVLLNPFLGLPWWRALALFVLVLIGVLTYFGTGHLLRAFRISEFKAALRRTP